MTSKRRGINSMRFFMMVLFLFLLSSASGTDNSLGQKKVLKILFQNLETPLSNGECESSRKCVVKQYLENTLSYMAEEGFNHCRPKYQHEKQSKIQKNKCKNKPDGQPAWASTECKKLKKNDFSENVRANPIYFKALLNSLAQVKSKIVYECTASWGVDFQEIKWSREIRFSLESDKKTVISNSFATIATP
jgi:hypothetical protein